MEGAGVCSRTPQFALAAAVSGSGGEIAGAADPVLPNRVSVGHAVRGRAGFMVRGDEMAIEAEARCLESGVHRLQHLRGHAQGRGACRPNTRTGLNCGVIVPLETERVAAATTSPLPGGDRCGRAVNTNTPLIAVDCRSTMDELSQGLERKFGTAATTR